MVRAEPTNTRKTGEDTYHSTMFTLLLELNVIYMGKGGFCSNGKIVSTELLSSMAKLHCQYRITTKIFDTFRIITLKQKIFSQSDPVLIYQFSKRLQSDPVLIRAHLCWLRISNNCFKMGTGRIRVSDPVCFTPYLSWAISTRVVFSSGSHKNEDSTLKKGRV